MQGSKLGDERRHNLRFEDTAPSVLSFLEPGKLIHHADRSDGEVMYSEESLAGAQLGLAGLQIRTQCQRSLTVGAIAHATENPGARLTKALT